MQIWDLFLFIKYIVFILVFFLRKVYTLKKFITMNFILL